MRHHRVIAWERKLKRVFDRIDDALELKYGDDFPLHPARRAQGETANKETDGLFNVGASFSAGYGSRLGRGYVVRVRMATLEDIPDELRARIQDEVAKMLRDALPRAFPRRRLRVERDENVYKIYGDLTLGKAR